MSFVRLIHRDTGTPEDGGDEIRLREGANEGSPAIDNRVRHASDAELVRQVRELVGLDADRPHLR